MKKNNPFKVPDNYFENFNKDIISKISNITEVETKKKNSIKFYLQSISVAAVFSGVIFLGYDYIDKTNSNSNTTIISQEDQNTILSNNDEVINSEKQLASLQNDYYLFIEDEAVKQLYDDYIDVDNL